MKKIEKYSMEGNKPKVIMSINVAKNIKTAINSYMAGIDASGHSFAAQNKKFCTGRHIAETFLVDENSKKLAKENYDVFYNTVKAKVEELTT